MTPAQRLLRLGLRDALVLAGVAALWALALRLGPALGAVTLTVAVATAVATALAGFLLHEWGHLAGAWFAGARVELPERVLASPFLFRYDLAANSRRQFCAMSLGGFAASLATLVALVGLLPLALLATQLTLALVALGVVATLVLEVPDFWRAWRGGPLPAGGTAYVGSRGDR